MCQSLIKLVESYLNESSYRSWSHFAVREQHNPKTEQQNYFNFYVSTLVQVCADDLSQRDVMKGNGGKDKQGKGKGGKDKQGKGKGGKDKQGKGKGGNGKGGNGKGGNGNGGSKKD